MEYDYHWHGKPPTHEEAKKALKKLRTLDGKIAEEGAGSLGEHAAVAGGAQGVAAWLPSRVPPCFLSRLAARFSWAVFSGFFFASLCESMLLLMIDTSGVGD